MTILCMLMISPACSWHGPAQPHLCACLCNPCFTCPTWPAHPLSCSLRHTCMGASVHVHPLLYSMIIFLPNRCTHTCACAGPEHNEKWARARGARQHKSARQHSHSYCYSSWASSRECWARSMEAAVPSDCRHIHGWVHDLVLEQGGF